ncbi:hypothetical protein PoB_005110200 [Plakobranchus ocellatus]|uniref:Uncharacterized protein n=1 Tax=Plakobranchus ocellatus TaxID=259542 RepID=A0AAV4BZ19_9GAST|nr:hypothetical protein PoB_005110200 [Plakobranchus ocellatus]
MVTLWVNIPIRDPSSKQTVQSSDLKQRKFGAWQYLLLTYSWVKRNLSEIPFPVLDRLTGGPVYPCIWRGTHGWHSPNSSPDAEDANLSVSVSPNFRFMSTRPVFDICSGSSPPDVETCPQQAQNLDNLFVPRVLS